MRPLRASDRDLLCAAFARLSPASRSQRFLGVKLALSAAELDSLTRLDHITRDAVVALERASARLVGVARYAVHASDSTSAEVAVTIADDWQGRGLGRTLSRTIVCRAAGSGIARLTAAARCDNVRSRSLMDRLGFHAVSRQADVIEFVLDLRRAPRPPSTVPAPS